MAVPVTEPKPQSDPVVGVNDWTRVGAAWDRVFDDVSTVGADLKSVFREAYTAAQSDERSLRPPAEGMSATVSSLAADQLVGVSAHVDRGLAGAKAVMHALGETLHDGGTERLHGEVEGAVKVSLYEMGMLLIRMSEKLDGDIEASQQVPVAPAPEPPLSQPAPEVHLPSPVPEPMPEPHVMQPEPVAEIDIRDLRTEVPETPDRHLVVICPD